MAGAYVQSTTNTFAGASSGSLTLTGVASGAVLVLGVQVTTASARTFTADNGMTSQISAVTPSASTYRQEIFIATGLSGSVTITATPNTSATFRLTLAEFSGIDTTTPVEASGKNETTTSSTSQPLAVSPGIDISAGSSVFGLVQSNAGGSWGTYTPASGLTAINNTTTLQTLRGDFSGASSGNTLAGTLGTSRAVNACVISMRQIAASGGQPFRKRWGGVAHNAYTRRGSW